MTDDFDRKQDRNSPSIRPDDARVLRLAATPACLLDPSGLIVEMSDTFCEMMGSSRESIKETPFSALDLSLAPSLSASEKPRVTRFQRWDGSSFPVEITAASLVLGQKNFLYCSLRDLSHDRETKKKIELLSDFNTLLLEINRAVGQSLEESSFLATVCNLCVRHGHMDRAWIGRPDTTGEIHMFASSGPFPSLPGLASSDHHAQRVRSSVDRAFRDGRTDYSGDKDHGHPPISGEEKPEDFGVLGSLPLWRGKKIWAVLSFEAREGSPFNDEIRRLYEQIVMILSRELDRFDQVRQESQIPSLWKGLLENNMAGIALLRDRKILQVNQRFVTMLGYDHAGQLLGQDTRILYPDDLESDRIQNFYPVLADKGHANIPSLRLRRRNGEVLLCDVPITLVPDPEGTTVIATLFDITEFHRLKRGLEHTLSYQQTLCDNNGAGLIVLDDKRIIRELNPAFLRMTGYSREELVGSEDSLLSENQESFLKISPRLKKALAGETFQTESGIRCKNGSLVWTEIMGSPLRLPDGGHGVILSVVDVTSLHEAREMIMHKVCHDSLTGMPNRLALGQAITGAISRARRKGTAFAVGMFDLDDFKPVNDRFGHEAGNRLLRELARRLKIHLRESDFLARISGDEFVAVIEDLEIGRATYQLSRILERLHQAVESPFTPAPGAEATVGMSMGLAFFPSDGEDTDTLLRQADAAMYQAKINKHERAEWWRISPFPLNSPLQEDPFDAYGPDTNDLLTRHSAHIESVINEFVESFFAQVTDDPLQKKLLSTMDESETQMIANMQSNHFRFLLSPSTTRTMILERAGPVGRVHALAGVNGPLLSQSMGLYRRLLSDHLNQTFLTARDRYRILLANEVRLQDDLQGELKSGVDTTGDYFALLSGALPQSGALWTDVRSREVEALGKLPGLQCVFLMRLNSSGTFVVEESSGPRGAEGAAIMRDPAFEAVIDPDSPRGQGLIAHAWRSLQIQRTPSYSRDPRLPHWREVVAPLGIRSAVSIPVRNVEGKAVAVVSLYGAYPNQFESPWMQQFAMGLGQRWEKIWELCRTSTAVLREDQAMDYRKELFSGGLTMYMQPVVDLATGKPVKVEALARLKRSDGEIVSPGFFLPILGDTELDRLFRMGLDETLSWISRWEVDGLSIDVSLNLPPGTLRDPDCPQWVEEALGRHKITPSRLTLELLENREIDHQSQDHGINRLLALGIKLAMDDLGSGYSSLQRLSSLAFDNIKVDQGLLKRIRTAPLQTLSMIGTIVRMGHDFERDVVVEGLEDAGMVEAAAILGSPYGQGYALARPMPAELLVSWSRTFAPPVHNGWVTTFLGALAFHWKLMHSGQPFDTCPPILDCPMTRFFDEKGLSDTDGARWHACLHQHEKDFEDTSRRLTNWLVERVREEVPE